MNKNKINEKINKLTKQVSRKTIPRNKSAKSWLMLVASELLAGIFTGGILGYYTDKFFNTSPIFLAFFSILGFFASLLNVYRAASKDLNIPHSNIDK
jgi:F0F1-type ATP synthase assembly protein I